MIKLERTKVMNFENAIRGMRNPLNSWEKSDSYWDFPEYPDRFVIGEADLELARKLCRAGSDHRKYLRQIFVSVDITAPLYWWKEYDTYKVGTVANSCSTMHKIHAKEFTQDDFSFERTHKDCAWFIQSILNVLNTSREKFLETKEKVHWENMIQFLPSSYNQMRTCTLTYENLIAMFYARKNHKLSEWHTFCDWIETLPYFKEICLGGESNGE